MDKGHAPTGVARWFSCPSLTADTPFPPPIKLVFIYAMQSKKMAAKNVFAVFQVFFILVLKMEVECCDDETRNMQMKKFPSYST